MLPVSLNCPLSVINNKTLTKFLILSMRLLFRILLNTINVREQKMDNSEKLATLGTQDTGRRPLKQKHTTVRKTDTNNVNKTRVQIEQSSIQTKR
jgi:hypothetical protein